MNDILLHTDQLTVGYHDEALIRDITFSVRAGQILTLIGPNGAGKSTILKSISRQLAPSPAQSFYRARHSRNCHGSSWRRPCPFS